MEEQPNKIETFGIGYPKPAHDLDKRMSLHGSISCDHSIPLMNKQVKELVKATVTSKQQLLNDFNKLFISRRREEEAVDYYEILPEHNTMKLTYKEEQPKTTTTNKFHICKLRDTLNTISNTADKKLRDKARFKNYRTNVDGTHNKQPRSRINLGIWDVDKNIKEDILIEEPIIEDDSDFINLKTYLSKPITKRKQDDSLNDFNWFDYKPFEVKELSETRIFIKDLPLKSEIKQNNLKMENTNNKPLKIVPTVHKPKVEHKDNKNYKIAYLKLVNSVNDLINNLNMDEDYMNNIMLIDKFRMDLIELVTPKQVTDEDKIWTKLENLKLQVDNQKEYSKCKVEDVDLKKFERSVEIVDAPQELKAEEIFVKEEENINLSKYEKPIEIIEAKTELLKAKESFNLELQNCTYNVIDKLAKSQKEACERVQKKYKIKSKPKLQQIKIEKVNLDQYKRTIKTENVPKPKTVKVSDVNKTVKKNKFFKADLLTPGQLAFCNYQAKGDKEVFDKFVKKVFRSIFYKHINDLQEKWFSKTKVSNLDIIKANVTLKSIQNEDIVEYAKNLNLWIERVVPKVLNDIKELDTKVKNKSSKKITTLKC